MKKQSIWEQITKPFRPPQVKEERFEDWDWKQNDNEFYEAFHRNPNSQDP